MSRFTFIKSHRNQLLIIITIAVILRLVAAFYMGNQAIELPGTADQLSYHTLATRIVNGFGFTFEREWWPVTKAGAPTAHWSYLYTLFLVRVYKIFGINPIIARIIQSIIVGILHPYLAYIIGKKIFNPNIGILTAGLTAIYTYFVYYSATLMTEPFYIIAILTSLYFSLIIVDKLKQSKKDSVNRQIILISTSLGLMLGAAVLLRQLFLLFIPFLYLWIWLSVYKQGGRSIITSLTITTIVIVSMILPFTIFNYTRFNRFVLLNTNAGYALYWANHPIYGTKFIPILPGGTYQELIPNDIRTMDEAALDQELLRRGIHFILDDPVRYIKLSISRIAAYFIFWPSSDSEFISNISRVSSFGVFLPFMIYGVYLSISNRTSSKYSFNSPLSLLLLFILVYSAIHILTWALIRYRLPVDAILIFFAGVTLSEVFHRFITWRNPSQLTA